MVMRVSPLIGRCFSGAPVGRPSVHSVSAHARRRKPVCLPSAWRAPARERMNSRRAGGKLEAGLCPVLHFLGDFYEIPSIYFIARRPEGARFKMISSKNGTFHSCFIARPTKHVPRRILRARHRLRPQDRARSKRAYSRQSSRSDAFEVMQGNFGKTIKADRNGSASHSNRGVANHIAILP